MAGKPRQLTPGGVFKAAQGATAWLLSAEKLAAAAEVIFKHEQSQEIPYFRAVDKAGLEAVSLAASSADGSAVVNVESAPPNYLPAELLYAFAIENALKGLIVSKEPNLLNEVRVSRVLTTHNLLKLAERAGMQVFVQEKAVLKALSHIGEWAGRYPIAVELKKYVEEEYPLGLNPDSLLDWGSEHPIIKRFLSRSLATLERALPQPVVRSEAVVAHRPP